MEEQFYLLWPNIVSRLKRERLPYFFLGIILVLCVIRVVPFGDDIRGVKLIKDILRMSVIELMAVGGLAAYLLRYQPELIKRVFTTQFFYWLNVAVVIFLLFRPANYFISGVAFATLILFIVQEDGKIQFNLRFRLLDKLGNWSYGIYMYHPIVMLLTFATIHHLPFLAKGSYGYNIAVYGFTFGITLVVSYLSYTYYEHYFIGIKNSRYTVIESGKPLPLATNSAGR